MVPVYVLKFKEIRDNSVALHISFVLERSVIYFKDKILSKTTEI